MDKNNRLEIIRAKARKVGQGAQVVAKGLYAVAHPEQTARRKKTGNVKAVGLIRRYNSPFGIILPGPTEHTMDWIYAPNKRKAKREGHRHEPHALSRIAEKLKRGWHK